jgi:hypothetical protein
LRAHRETSKTELVRDKWRLPPNERKFVGDTLDLKLCKRQIGRNNPFQKAGHRERRYSGETLTHITNDSTSRNLIRNFVHPPLLFNHHLLR